MMNIDNFSIEQHARYEGDNWWKWSVWIEGTDEALDRIEYVEWRLHPTFPNPIRKITDRSSRFRLDTSGWGTFRIIARIVLKDGTENRLLHDLVLKRTDGTQAFA
jgi:transcription initiation factor IIF auxiliary subunit